MRTLFLLIRPQEDWSRAGKAQDPWIKEYKKREKEEERSDKKGENKDN